jgi:hypothetical protein
MQLMQQGSKVLLSGTYLAADAARWTKTGTKKKTKKKKRNWRRSLASEEEEEEEV